MTKALIFDFDGTMIDSEWMFYESIHHYLLKPIYWSSSAIKFLLQTTNKVLGRQQNCPFMKG
ncbi:TPA: HAD hydrolase-like protein [Enterococcus faecium]|nr:HAD hydrolase-like protein [Enterococcus faecium]